jgi:hypothetical protein
MWLLSQCNVNVDAELGDLAAIIYEQYGLPGAIPAPLEHAVQGSRGSSLKDMWRLATRTELKKLLLMRWIARTSWSAPDFKNELSPLLEDPIIIENEPLRQAYTMRMTELLRKPTCLDDLWTDRALDFCDATSAGFLELLGRRALLPSRADLPTSDFARLARHILEHPSHGHEFARRLLDDCVGSSRPRSWFLWAMSLVAAVPSTAADSALLDVRQLDTWLVRAPSYAEFLRDFSEISKLLFDLRRERGSDGVVPTTSHVAEAVAANPTLQRMASNPADVLRASRMSLFHDAAAELQQLHFSFAKKIIRVRSQTHGWADVLRAAAAENDSRMHHHAAMDLTIDNAIVVEICKHVLELRQSDVSSSNASAGTPSTAGSDPTNPMWLRDVDDAEFWCLIFNARGQHADRLKGAQEARESQNVMAQLAHLLRDKQITLQHARLLQEAIRRAPSPQSIPSALHLVDPALNHSQWQGLLEALAKNMEGFEQEKDELLSFLQAVDELAGQWLLSPTPSELARSIDERHGHLTLCPWATWADPSQRWDPIVVRCAAWPQRKAFVQLAKTQVAMNATLHLLSSLAGDDATGHAVGGAAGAAGEPSFRPDVSTAPRLVLFGEATSVPLFEDDDNADDGAAADEDEENEEDEDLFADDADGAAAEDGGVFASQTPHTREAEPSTLLHRALAASGLAAADLKLRQFPPFIDTPRFLEHLQSSLFDDVNRNVARATRLSQTTLSHAALLFVSPQGSVNISQLPALQRAFELTLEHTRRLENVAQTMADAAQLQHRALNLRQLHRLLASSLQTAADNDSLLTQVHLVLEILVGDPNETMVTFVDEAMGELLRHTAALPSDAWDLVEELSRSDAALSLMREIGQDEDLRNLAMAAEENAGTFFSASEDAVQAFSSLHTFMRPLLDESTADLQAFIQRLTQRYEQYQQRGEARRGAAANAPGGAAELRPQAAAFQTLPMMIQLCNDNAVQLERLWRGVTDRSNVARTAILDALDRGLLDLKCDTFKAQFSMEVVTHNRRFSWEDLLNYQGRAQLYIRREHGERMEEFVLCVEELRRTVALLADMARSGDLGIFEMLHSQREIPLSLEEVRIYTESLIIDRDDSRQKQDDYSRHHFPALRHFYGQQITQLFRALFTRRCDSSTKSICRHLLALAARATQVDHTQDYHPIAWLELPQSNVRVNDKLAALGEHLAALIPAAGIPAVSTAPSQFPPELLRLESPTAAPARALQNALQSNNAVVLLRCESHASLICALGAATLLFGRLPCLADAVLLAHEGTGWAEVERFLLRCEDTRASSSVLVPAVVCGHDRLSMDVQTRLTAELRKWRSERHVRRRSVVLLLHADSTTDNVSGDLPSLSRQIWPSVSQDELEAVVQAACNGLGDVSFVSSAQPGLGKSQWVRNQAEEVGLRLQTVHLFGSAKADRVYEQIAKAFPLPPADDHTNAVHLDLGAVQPADLPALQFMLLEMLVLRRLTCGVSPVAVPLSCNFFIEVGNTLGESLFHGLVLRSAFPHTALKWEGGTGLTVSPEPTSDVQVVCRFLEALSQGALDDQPPDDTAVLPAGRCADLLGQYYTRYQEEDCSYAEIDVFIRILAEQMRRFSNSIFIMPDCLDFAGVPRSARSQLCQALVNTVNDFAVPSVARVRGLQTVHLSPITGEEQANALLARFQAQRRWVDRDHALVLMHKDGSMAVLYSSPEILPAEVRHLLTVQAQMREQQSNAIPDLNGLEQWQMVQTLRQLAVDDACDPAMAQMLAQSLVSDRGNYVLTLDTLLKGAVILQRLDVGTPVILMGEAGAGKTSLLSYLARISGVDLKVCPVHAGTPLAVLERVASETAEAAHQQPDQRFILFYDEINTSEHVGFIVDLIVHKTGLPDNVLPVGACNPYRRREQPSVSVGLQHEPGPAELGADAQNFLRYRVLPLPEAALTFVWDYGALHEDDEQLYIAAMLEGLTRPVLCDFARRPDGELGIELDHDSVPWLARVLHSVHGFYRTREQEVDMTVSLRDVSRFKRLAVFFAAYFRKRQQCSPRRQKKGGRKGPSTLPRASDGERAFLVAIYFAYVLRLQTIDLRKDLLTVIANAIRSSGMRMSPTFEEIRDVMREEQLDLFDRMETDCEPYLAQNHALMENIFCLTFSVLTREPCFLVGKPGCSKSLSIRIVNHSLKGADARDELLRCFPTIHLLPYQGSEESTSEGIEAVFEKARRYLLRSQQMGSGDGDVIPVVLLDEISLAERSPSRPLKVGQ